MRTKAKDLRRRSSADLREEVKRLQGEAFQRTFLSKSEEKTDRGFVRRTRRDVARVLTVLRERELGHAAEPAGGKS